MDFVDDDRPEEADDFLRNDVVQELLKDPTVSLRLLTTSGRYLYVSRGVKELPGYEPKEFVKFNAFELVHPDDIWAVNQARNALEEGPVEMVVRARHKRGHYHWVRTHMTLEHGLVSVAVQPAIEPLGGANWAPTDPFF